VGAEAGKGFDRPALAVAQQLRRHTEQRLDLRSASGMVAVVDLGAQERRPASGLGAIGAERSMIRMASPRPVLVSANSANNANK
jgi:hypothetical protein